MTEQAPRSRRPSIRPRRMVAATRDIGSGKQHIQRYCGHGPTGGVATCQGYAGRSSGLPDARWKTWKATVTTAAAASETMPNAR